MRLGSYRWLLLLALSAPELSLGLGLGAMRVDSRLDEPLSAQIEILGATPAELKELRAAVADVEVFQRHRLERPAFLATAKFMVAFDEQGQPVLNVQSTEAFTEPLVDFLIDLRWGHEELLRNYTVLLDPAASSSAAATPVAAVPGPRGALPAPLPADGLSEIILTTGATSAAIAPQPARSLQSSVATGTQHRITAHDTLRNIARHAGARSDADQQRMMLAIFQANPQAFAGNINRLHRGAVLKIPPLAQIHGNDTAMVDRAIDAQMAAWRQSRPGVPPSQAAAAPLGATPTSAGSGHEMSKVLSAMNQLDGRVQFLQQRLGETNRQLATAAARISHVEQHAMPLSPAVTRPAAAVAPTPVAKSAHGIIGWALALLAAGLAYAGGQFLPASARRRRSSEHPPPESETPTIEAPVIDMEAHQAVLAAMAETQALWAGTAVAIAPEVPSATVTAAPARAQPVSVTVEITQPVEIDVDAFDERRDDTAQEPDTVIMEAVEPTPADRTTTRLDYNLSDLDGRSQHVEMPGSLHEHALVVERRKNIVDSLMAAIQRDPTRSDLRIKLLETLYAAASKNLRAFKEVVRDLTRHPERLSASEWEQINVMGREIAPDDALFEEPPADENMADCA